MVQCFVSQSKELGLQVPAFLSGGDCDRDLHRWINIEGQLHHTSLLAPWSHPNPSSMWNLKLLIDNCSMCLYGLSRSVNNCIQKINMCMCF